MKIAADFVISAATARDFPRGNLGEIALVGRSNVGKSSLINALVRRSIARTSASPGKTRLANIYRVARGAGEPFHLVDLPGYGYARGGSDEFIAVTRAFFGREGREGRVGQEGRDWQEGDYPPAEPGRHGPPARIAALLVVDSRHPGLQSDIDAWRWLQSTVERSAVVATKIDKLARGQRIRAMRELESVFDASVTLVSAVTGEGLDELWKLMDRLANSRSPRSSPPRATAPRPPKK